MFNFQQCIAASVTVFCVVVVISVAVANNAADAQFIESSWNFFSPLPSQSNQNEDNQTLESSPFIHVYTAPEISPSYTNLWDFSFDLFGTPADYRQEYEDLIAQEDYIYKGSDTACGNCGPLPQGSFADPLREEQLMPNPRTIQAPTPFIQPFQMIQYPFWELPY